MREHHHSRRLRHPDCDESLRQIKKDRTQMRADDELRTIHYKVMGTQIGRKDTVSGEFHLRLLREYRAYDRRQKESIMELQREVMRLNQRLADIRADRQMYVDVFNSVVVQYRSDDREARQRAQIVQLLAQNERLRRELREMKEKYEQPQNK